MEGVDTAPTFSGELFGKSETLCLYCTKLQLHLLDLSSELQSSK